MNDGFVKALAVDFLQTVHLSAEEVPSHVWGESESKSSESFVSMPSMKRWRASATASRKSRSGVMAAGRAVDLS
jgi:hypothetical protein